MKHNNIRKSTSLLLCLSLLCSLLLMCSGCGNKEKEALVGTWQTTVDLTDMLNDEMKAGAAGNEEMLDYFPITDFSFKMNLTFRDDGTYEMVVDEAAMEKTVDGLMDTFKTGANQYFEDLIAAEGVDMSVDDVLSQMGLTLDGLIEQLFDKDTIMASADEMESKGTFEAKNGVLSLTDDEGTGLESYKLDGNTLTLTGEGVEDADALMVYPMVFTKQ